jgi:superfamily II DNA or RNA helicase
MAPAPTSPFFAEWTLKQCRATKSKKTPAPHQKEALGKLNAWYAKLTGEDGGILALPTGAGKTFTAAHFLCNGPLSQGYKVLWLAHTHHLLEQAFHTFSPEMLGHIREPRSSLKLRVVSGTPGHFPPRDIKPTDDILIATLQTITSAHRENLPQLRQFIESAGGKLLVVFDEAHHSPAPSYRKLMMGFQGDGMPALGLTATPTYSDETKKGWLKKIFPQGILAQARAGDLIAQGILAKPHFERAPTSVVPDFDDVDYQKWLGTYRDVPEDVITHLAKNAERNAFIAQTYVNSRARYGKTIIFTDRWFQCEAIVEALGKRGVKADAIYSHEDATIASVEGRKKRGRDENAKALERFKTNEVDVLVNVRMLTEGTDLPDAQSVFITRQTTSQILLTQMVGRALRGPAFGGTADAYIVSFVDEWQQSIRWAEYDPLTDGPADDSARTSTKRPPLQLISIDLIKKLAQQMDSGTNVTSGPFTSLMPVGWYRVTFDVCLPDGDQVEARDQLVMVFDDERAGFEKLIDKLSDSAPEIFGEEDVSFEAQKTTLDAWRGKFLGSAARMASDLNFDVFSVARHVAQGHGRPEFFPFEIRQDHDLDAIAKAFIERDLGPKGIRESLLAEYERKDRFWRALFPRFEQLRSYYDGCQARLLGATDGDIKVLPTGRETPTEREPSEEVKAQVKRRDGNQCLACGATKYLQVDHIRSWHRGGSNDIDNLQTLCKVCNSKKETRTIRFTTQQTTLATPPNALEHFDTPRGDDAGDRAHWERFLRQVINFTFRCGAVSAVQIAGRGDGYYNWRVELVRGNSPSWLAPHLEQLFERIKDAREAAGKPAIDSITITSPGEDEVCCSRF